MRKRLRRINKKKILIGVTYLTAGVLLVTVGLVAGEAVGLAVIAAV